MISRSGLVLLLTILSISHNEAYVCDRTVPSLSPQVRRKWRCRSFVPTNRPPTTSLNPHRFNGGYDPASPLTWTPKQAAEFTVFHHGEPRYIGLQLRLAVQHWSGSDLAEFLTRLYLGQREEGKPKPTERNELSVWTFGEESKHKEIKQNLVYEPRNVRSPQWMGLETREGVLALKELLKEALSPDTAGPREIARFAEAFLLKEYKWPRRKDISTGSEENLASKSNNSTTSPSNQIVFEQDSFYSRGHAETLARILWSIRNETSKPFKWDDIAEMVTLPEHENKEVYPLQLTKFYKTLADRTPIASTEKVQVVARLAMGGWSPSKIPKFMKAIVPDDIKNKRSTYVLDEELFKDFPLAAEVVNKTDHNNLEQDDECEEGDQHILDATEEQVLLVSTLKRATLSVRSEYDHLVQAYWKQVEIPKSKRRLMQDETVKSDQIEEAKNSNVGANLK